MTSIIERRVYLNPKYLDQNIMEHLLSKIREDTFGECTKDHGHILSVKRIVSILHNEDTVFTVRFEAETLCPKAGDKLSGIVCMLYKDGILFNISNRQKMLIPSINLSGYEFDEISRSYYNGNRKIKEGDEIQAIVIAVRYDKKSFSCFGSLI